MEDRNVLRRMESERRNQEVQQRETCYDAIAPLFNEPYKINKGDELSTLIQRMLGNFEDGCDVAPLELCSVFPFGHSTRVSQADLSNHQKSLGHMDRSASVGESLPVSSDLPGGSGQKSENWDSGRLPVLSPPTEPLSPLRSSDVEDPCPEPRQVEPLQLEAPLLANTLPLNLHCKSALVNPKKPTAYVRPMDGQDQVTHISPDVKASPEAYEHFPDHKNAVSLNRALKRPPQSDIGCHEAERVNNILKEMTSWPELLTSICTPSTREPLTLLVHTEETHTFSTHKAHESSDTVERDQQGSSSISSDSDGSSSDTDSEIICPGGTLRSPHTQADTSKDWQLGRWLEMKESQQQNSESLCYDIKTNSLNSPARPEVSEDQQGCYSNPTHNNTEANHTQTVATTRARESLRVESAQFQRNTNTSTHTAKENKKKSKKGRVRTESRTQDLSVCNTTHTTRFSCHSLLVKIELNLLFRVPQEPERVTKRHSLQKNPGHKRPTERERTFERKKQKMDKEENQFSSSQNTISQTELSSKAMKKSVKHKPILPPESQQKKAEAHGKKICKNHNASKRLMCPKPRALLQLEHRQLAVEDYMREAKKLKHKADAMLDKMSKALSYLEAALSFVESGLAMEADPQMPRSAYTMFSDTLELIRFILKLKNYTDSSTAAHERDFYVLCLRCESLLQMAMFRYRRDSALKYSRTLTEHFKPIQQVAASYVDITALFLNAVGTWEQADEVARRGSGLLRELDCVVGSLSLTSSMSSLVQYTRHGLHWIRHNP